MQLRYQWSLAVAVALVLALAAGEARSAGPTRPRPKPAGQAASAPADAPGSLDPSAAAEALAAEAKAVVAEEQVDWLKRAFRGDENTWFVVVLLEGRFDGRTLGQGGQFTLVQGRTAAAQTVLSFYAKGNRLQKGFEYRAFDDPARAQACYMALLQQSWMAVEATKAAAQQQFNRLKAVFRGSEDTWFVLVMQDRGSNGKGRRFAVVQGRTAAALTVLGFLCGSNRAQKAFQYHAFAHPAQAQACCQALMQYSFRTGYR